MGFSEKVLRTLIVEDEASFRRIFKEKLEAIFPSMVIYEAAEGNEAIRKVDTLKPELVFMDIRLPGEDGIQLTRRIKTNYPTTKIIFITGFDSPDYRKEAIRAGGSCYLLKQSLDHVQIEQLVKSLVQ